MIVVNIPGFFLMTGIEGFVFVASSADTIITPLTNKMSCINTSSPGMKFLNLD
jgi:hypothetical protein